MKNVYILGGLRTPIVVKNVKFRNIRPEHFGAKVLQKLIEKYQLKNIDGIFAGNAVGTGGNIARLMSLEAGISDNVPACTIDMQCASSAAAIDIARMKITCGNGDLFLAGGMESSSLQPLRIYDTKDDRYMQIPGGCYKTAQFSPGELSPMVMLEGAERVVQIEQIKKTELDYWVLKSHQRACLARDKKLLESYIVPINGWSIDNGLHDKINQRLLNRLPPILGPGTSITAANTCHTNDGAAFIILCSENYCKKNNIKPNFRLLDALEKAGPPKESPRGAMRAADALLTYNSLSYYDMDSIEFNEAFAVIDVLFARRFPKLTGHYNQLGGALAYGHPYGASGAILALHLMRSLCISQGKYGLAAIAGAGGTGAAFLIEQCRR